jgi:hypothetical protein
VERLNKEQDLSKLERIYGLLRLVSLVQQSLICGIIIRLKPGYKLGPEFQKDEDAGCVFCASTRGSCRLGKRPHDVDGTVKLFLSNIKSPRMVRDGPRHDWW